ncbi:hypothetical protein Scep_019493 [Stephania cephalantha]|uniref:Uncharacterized protein n=1 Tax=Stephania cephalantha TaxID=152367 RepID=A0AAP0IAV7_9MAGN
MRNFRRMSIWLSSRRDVRSDQLHRTKFQVDDEAMYYNVAETDLDNMTDPITVSFYKFTTQANDYPRACTQWYIPRLSPSTPRVPKAPGKRHHHYELHFAVSLMSWTFRIFQQIPMDLTIRFLPIYPYLFYKLIRPRRPVSRQQPLETLPYFLKIHLVVDQAKQRSATTYEPIECCYTKFCRFWFCCMTIESNKFSKSAGQIRFQFELFIEKFSFFDKKLANSQLLINIESFYYLADVQFYYLHFTTADNKWIVSRNYFGLIDPHGKLKSSEESTDSGYALNNVASKANSYSELESPISIKRAYVQQLESRRSRLSQLEQDL